MCTSIYLGACRAMEEMAGALGMESDHYTRLLEKGSKYSVELFENVKKKALLDDIDLETTLGSRQRL